MEAMWVFILKLFSYFQYDYVKLFITKFVIKKV